MIRRLAIIMVFAWAAHAAPAQDRSVHADRIIQRLTAVLTSANADSLISWTSDPVEIAMFGVSRTYSRSQGSYVLRQLFESTDMRSFHVLDHSHSPRGLFLEGRVQSAVDQGQLRIYFRFKQLGTEWKLMEILVERSS